MSTIICLIFGMLAIYYLHICINSFKFLQLSKKRINEKYRFDNDILNVEDIYGLTPREFEMWSGDFLTRLGYEDIENTELGPDGGKDIICKKNDELVYVECKKYYYTKYAPRFVTELIIKKLIGAMIHDGINKGVIITTGLVTEEAIDFAQTLNKNVSIKIIDWKEILEIYNSGKLDIENNKFRFSEV